MLARLVLLLPFYGMLLFLTSAMEVCPSISDGSSMTKGSQYAQAHGIQFEHFSKFKIKPDDVKRMMQLHGYPQDTELQTPSPLKIVSIDVEPIMIDGESMPLRVTLINDRNELLLDKLVSDWVRPGFQLQQDFSFYNFNQKINRFRSDRKQQLLRKLKDDARKVRKKTAGQSPAVGVLKKFVQDDAHAIDVLNAGERRGWIGCSVQLFMERFGKSLDDIKAELVRLCQNAIVVGHDLEHDLQEYLKMPDLGKLQLDTQRLYRGHRCIERDTPLNRPSLRKLANDVLCWKIQEMERGLDMNKCNLQTTWDPTTGQEDNEADYVPNAENVKGTALFGHSSLEDARATMLLLLKKMEETRRDIREPGFRYDSGWIIHQNLAIVNMLRSILQHLAPLEEWKITEDLVGFQQRECKNVQDKMARKRKLERDGLLFEHYSFAVSNIGGQLTNHGTTITIEYLQINSESDAKRVREILDTSYGGFKSGDKSLTVKLESAGWSSLPTTIVIPTNLGNPRHLVIPWVVAVQIDVGEKCLDLWSVPNAQRLNMLLNEYQNAQLRDDSEELEQRLQVSRRNRELRPIARNQENLQSAATEDLSSIWQTLNALRSKKFSKCLREKLVKLIERHSQAEATADELRKLLHIVEVGICGNEYGAVEDDLKGKTVEFEQRHAELREEINNLRTATNAFSNYSKHIDVKQILKAVARNPQQNIKHKVIRRH